MAIKRFFVDRSVQDHPYVTVFSDKLSAVPEFVDDAAPVYAYVNAAQDIVRRGKETLFLTRNKGAFVRDCPGTRSYLCCDYRILHIGTFCHLDCAYCILQAYFHPPVLQLFLNHADLRAELSALFNEPRISRIGTGEFTDSLIWDLWTDFSHTLIPLFAAQDRAVLELKTKTVAIDRLKDLEHREKAIVAWSLNTPFVIASQERGTSSLDSRFRAAAACADWGYPLAFHFDPMAIYDGCENEYAEVIQRLFRSVPADRVTYISLGTFRFMPDLKPMVKQRFPDSRLVYGEFVPGLDGKMRYFKPLRLRLYRRVAEEIQRLAPDVAVYFCMEDEEVWEKALGWIPDETGIGRMLDRRVCKVCGLDSSFVSR